MARIHISNSNPIFNVYTYNNDKGFIITYAIRRNFTDFLCSELLNNIGLSTRYVHNTPWDLLYSNILTKWAYFIVMDKIN